MSPNSVSKSLEIKEKQERVSKINEALNFVNKVAVESGTWIQQSFFSGNYKRIIDVKITYLISRSDLLKEKKNYFHRKI